MTHSGATGIYFDSDSHHLLGTLFQAQGDDPKPTAVLLHGLPGIEKNYDLALALRAQGWNSLIFHYRGCWGSSGAYNLTTVPRDVVSALVALTSGAYPLVDPERLLLFGHSMGSWAAVVTAAQDPRPQAVIACAGVADPPGWAFDEAEAAESFTPWLTGVTPAQLVAQWDKLPSALDLVAEIAPRPLLIVHGTADDAVPRSQSDALAAAAGEPFTYHLVPNADHGFSWHRKQLIQYVVDWIAKQKI